MTKEELEKYRLIADQRNSMAVYLKRTMDCNCCLYRLSKEKCPDCKLMDSKWEWGGWKGKPTPEGTKVYADMSPLFEKYYEGKTEVTENDT